MGGTAILFFSGWIICLLTNSSQELQFLHILPNTCYFVFQNNDPPDGCKMVSHCGFDLHFPFDQWCWAFFHVLIHHLYIFEENLGQTLPIKKKNNCVVCRTSILTLLGLFILVYFNHLHHLYDIMSSLLLIAVDLWRKEIKEKYWNKNISKCVFKILNSLEKSNSVWEEMPF